MASGKTIIDSMFRAINERNLTTPRNSTITTRVEMLEIANQLYQDGIAKRLKNNIATFVYDGSDPAHTITAGVGTLPTDFLEPLAVFDGDAPDQPPLVQITSIRDKAADDAETRQFMIAGNNLWIFGRTPANFVKLYYLKRTAAITDATTTESGPTELKSEFHVRVFEYEAKRVYAMRRNNTDDMIDMEAAVADELDKIEAAHTAELQDDAPKVIRDVYGIFF